jgi:CheY-like chemotaxis protein
LNQANKSNGFELVWKPSDAIEKAAPGARNVLLGIVLDALASAKKQSLSERTLSVLIGGNLDACLDHLFLDQILEATQKEINIEIIHTEAIDEIMSVVAKRKFDLALLYLDFFRKDHEFGYTQRDRQYEFSDNQTILRRADLLQRENVRITNSGFVLISFLSKMHGIPVVVLTGSGYQGVQTEAKQAGASAFFPIPFADSQLVESLREIFLKQNK